MNISRRNQIASGVDRNLFLKPEVSVKSIKSRYKSCGRFALKLTQNINNTGNLYTNIFETRLQFAPKQEYVICAQIKIDCYFDIR